LISVKSGVSQNTHVEFVGGFTSSIFKGDEQKIFQNSNESFIRRYAGNVGVYFSVKSGENTRIRIGINYNGRGTGLEASSFLGVNAMAFIKMNYLEFPFQLAFGSEAVSFFLGPQLSFLTSYSGIQDPNKSDFGLKYGLGINGATFIFRLNSYTGLSNVTPWSSERVRNGYYEVSIGIRIPPGR